jgi:hypothetical protein
VAARADPTCTPTPPVPVVVYPQNPKDQVGIQKIRDKLQEQGQTFIEVKSDRLSFTAFFWVEEVEQQELEELNEVPAVSELSTRFTR